MTIRIDNIKLNIGESEDKLIKVASKKLGKPLKYFAIIKKSLDARAKSNICWIYSVAASDEPTSPDPTPEKLIRSPKVAIIGAGPAGLMCAIRLIEHGFTPVIIERGEAVEDRKKTTERFFSDRILDANSNVQFGEGGAGTFSDGKLNTQTHDGLNKSVLEIFYRFGAPEEILYLNKPHIGSDKLFAILQNMRAFILNNGGEYIFNTRLTGLKHKNGVLRSLELQNTRTGEETELNTGIAVIAIGHSSRDTFTMLNNSGLEMQLREFAVGVRIEHLASEIGKAQYGVHHKDLPTADYKLVSHAHERTVFTFCMCPGGVVIPSASEDGGVVTNGMSMYARDGVNSNSALMVQLKKEDFGADDLFAGMRFQQKIERLAYEAGGRNYCAPVQLYKDFALDKVSQNYGDIVPSYSAGYKFAPLNEVLPSVTVDALKVAIPDMGRRLKGFDCPYAVLTGVETRFSSPVKLLRDENCESVTISGLYPCGEGSGYSGGITSSAADGLKVAEKIFEKCKNH